MRILLTEPVVVERADQPYLAVPATVTMQTIGDAVPKLFGEILGQVGPQQLAGPPFIKYDVIDMARELLIQVGVPVRDGVPGPAGPRVVGGVLPAGRYLTAIHTGPYDRLEPATGRFLAWAQEHGHRFDVQDGERGEVWGCRLEFYPTDPAVQPDPQAWQTELAFRLRD